jgi:hypothetical protein
MKANGCKSIHVTFTTRKETWYPVFTNNVLVPEKMSTLSDCTLTGDLPGTNAFS